MQTKRSPVATLKDLLGKLLPPEKNYTPAVKPELQQQQLRALDDDIPNESFYFVFDLLKCEIDTVNGVEKWLGYSNKEFTVDRYLGIISPEQSLVFNLVAQNMYRILCGGTFKLKFGKQRYVSLIALRHYNGEYIVFKKTTTIFQYDTDNRLLAQLNEFTKIGNYEGETLKSRIAEMEGLQAADFERMVFKMCLEAFMEKKYFSRRELEMLQIYANDSGVGRQQLAEQMVVELSTIDTQSRRIIDKAKNTFNREFKSVKEIAHYLRREKIL